MASITVDISRQINKMVDDLNPKVDRLAEAAKELDAAWGDLPAFVLDRMKLQITLITEPESQTTIEGVGMSAEESESAHRVGVNRYVPPHDAEHEWSIKAQRAHVPYVIAIVDGNPHTFYYAESMTCRGFDSIGYFEVGHLNAEDCWDWLQLLRSRFNDPKVGEDWATSMWDGLWVKSD